MITSQDNDDRFAFGENWSRFLQLLDEDRIRLAERSLSDYLGVADLKGCRFLDIGSGSGLFSLAARRLGATVRSFDYDAQSVACTAELRRRFFGDDPDWVVEQGSILDSDYVANLGVYDVVYSWGVLHHTGAMWGAIESAAGLVAPNGKLYIAIYNRITPVRHAIVLTMKRAYVRSGPIGRSVLTGTYYAYATALEIAAALVHRRPLLERITNYKDSTRGMSWWHDIVDWVGGYPYESARPEQVFDFLRSRGFQLEKLRTDSGHGCNEFVFVADRGDLTSAAGAMDTEQAVTIGIM